MADKVQEKDAGSHSAMITGIRFGLNEKWQGLMVDT